jgi:hypothetical protein
MIEAQNRRTESLKLPMSTSLTPLVAFNADHELLRVVEQPFGSDYDRRQRRPVEEHGPQTQPSF